MSALVYPLQIPGPAMHFSASFTVVTELSIVDADAEFAEWF